MDKIGASTTWRWHGYKNAWTEIDGIQMKSVTGGGHSGAGMFISASDMARFGLLFLNDGVWKRDRLLSSTWIKEATSPSAPNPNYGYMWWLNEKEGRRHWPGVSEDIYYAAGFGGNFIVVDKEHDIVIVTRWLEPSKIGEFMKLVVDSFQTLSLRLLHIGDFDTIPIHPTMANIRSTQGEIEDESSKKGI